MAMPAIADVASGEKIAYLYVIGGDTGAHKVGFSVRPTARLRSLCIGSPVRLSIKHLVPVPWVTRKFTEKYAHALLESRHAHGEWYDVTADQALAAIKLADKGTRKGRLPPGKSVADVRGETTGTSGTPFGITTLTPQRAIAVRRYARLLKEASRPGLRDERIHDARRALDAVLDAVRANNGEVGVTLLNRVVGLGQCIGTLPGSPAVPHHERFRLFGAR